MNFRHEAARRAVTSPFPNPSNVFALTALMVSYRCAPPADSDVDDATALSETTAASWPITEFIRLERPRLHP